MFVQLKRSTDLAFRQQSLLLRPYLNVQDLQWELQNGSAPDERWNIFIVVGNVGDLPARQLRAIVWIDGRLEANRSDFSPPVMAMSIGPRGGQVAVPTSITKVEAQSILQSSQGCYLHIAMEYSGAADERYELRSTSMLVYREGKLLKWIPIGTSGY